MALVKNICKISRNSRLQTEAECTYNTLTQDGKKFIQINTYGTKERVHKNVVSQSIQLDEQSAKQLYEIIRSEYSFE